MDLIKTSVIFFLLIWFEEGGFIINLTHDGCTFAGDSKVVLSCKVTPGCFTEPIKWRNSKIKDADIATCNDQTCTNIGSFKRYNLTANSTGTYLEISNVSNTEDETNWTCIIGNDPQTVQIFLTVRDFVTFCKLENSGDMYICKTSCGHPSRDVTMKWILNKYDHTIESLTGSSPSNGDPCTTGLQSTLERKLCAGNISCLCGMQEKCPEKEPMTSDHITCKGGAILPIPALIVVFILIAIACAGIIWKWREREKAKKAKLKILRNLLKYEYEPTFNLNRERFRKSFEQDAVIS